MEQVSVYKDNASAFANNGFDIMCRSVMVSPDAILTQSPVETGVYINDCKVRRPIVIQMQVVLPIKEGWENTVRKIRDLHESFVVTGGSAMTATTEELAVVKTKDGVYYNMVLLNCPHTEGVENFSTFEFTLKFQELMIMGKTAQTSVNMPSDCIPVNLGDK